ncbi:hypothetical protein NFI96_018179 [Prochilodus magdalenae]|nr:hypothetical protein NFI96_018179 [Prochilodus magdalenae]
MSWQDHDVAPSSPSHEPAPPSLIDVIDAVKAAFEQAVKISKDKAVQEVFEQVVEELVPQQDVAEQSTAEDATEEGAADPTALQSMQEQDGEQDVVKHEVGLVQEPVERPVESVNPPTKFIYIQEQKEPVSESHQEAKKPTEEEDPKVVEAIQGLEESAEESVQEPEELEVESFEQAPKINLGDESEDKSISDKRDSESGGSMAQGDLLLDSAKDGEGQGKDTVEQAENDEGKEGQEIELLQEQGTEGGEVDDKTEEVEEVIDVDSKAKVQKGKLPKRVEQNVQTAESQPGEEQGVVNNMTPEGDMQVQDDQDKGEQRGEAESEAGAHEETGKAGREEERMMVLPAKATMVQQVSHEPVEVTLDTGRAAAVKDANEAMEPQEPVIEESNSMEVWYIFHVKIYRCYVLHMPADVTQETNEMNDIVTPKDTLMVPVEPSQNAPTPGNVALPPFLTPGPELGDMDELVEEPAENTQPIAPGQEVWKIGAIAAAFFLILQTAVTVVYILKCKRKPNRMWQSVLLCALSSFCDTRPVSHDMYLRRDIMQMSPEEKRAFVNALDRAKRTVSFHPESGHLHTTL